MGQYNRPPNLLELLASLKLRLAALENTKATPVVTSTTKPANVGEGTIIFVKDAAAGSKFQGWDGTSWVSLG